ncbi:MAG: hypothetical protein M1822_001848 [Bathelium mastoideum]|nr:MAG: hypothetical protein M1822_001848 [Bathelium mastoideum]
MPHSSKRSQPPSESDRSTSNRKKRKLQQAAGHTSTNISRQQSIPDSFTSQQKASSFKDDADRHPIGKKPRPDLSPSTPPKTQTPSKTMATADMYHFPQKRASQGAACVDLTASPDSSPKPRRPNGFHVSKGPSSSHSGAKKLTVKNLRSPSKASPTDYLEQVWTKLDAALDLTFREGKVTFPLEELYRGVENVCRQGFAHTLHSRLKVKCKANVAETLKAPIHGGIGEKNVDVLRAVIAAWVQWKTQMITVQSMFYYMDRSYLLQSPEPSLREMAIALFRNNIFDDTILKPKIIAGACDLIAADRHQEPLDNSIFRQAINMFHELTVYSNSFEPQMLELSQSYILQWSNQACDTMELATYVQACVQFVDREMTRCELCGLDTTTRKSLLVMLEDLLVEKRLSRLVLRQDVGQLLTRLLRDHNTESLEQLYSLLQRRRFGSKLRPAFESWINSTGESIVFDEAQQDQMIPNLLALKKQLDQLWRFAFQKDEELGHGLREAFETFMNKQKKTSATWNTDNSKPGEMIAKYVDELLRRGAKAIPAHLSAGGTKTNVAEEDDDDGAIDEDSEVNEQLDQVLDLFRFVHGKAVFEAFYKKDLARRLLMGRSASADAERSMLQRLKTECGAGFTQNLEQMFKDVELAREEMNSYKSILDERDARPSLDLNVNILSASAWPTYPDIPVIIPMDVSTAIESFTRHYKSKHGGRKLDWKHALAHCQIKASFAKGNKELVVSSFQAVVLLLFNHLGPDEHLSYEHIKTATGLTENEVKRTLQSLACAKLRPLTKHPKGKDINDDDTFTVNTGFQNEKYRVKINQVQLKETKEENKETHERVAADRAFETQAAIVRIMKSRKLISHPELVAEVIKATKSRGQLNVADIKKNIDRLIEKDYMEREENNSYSYLA